MATSERDDIVAGRYEFRVWGRHRTAERTLAKLADSCTREQVYDCYLLVPDSTWNAKIRGDAFKLKQLVTDRKGFEHWVSERHRSAKSTPSPFDELFDDLRLDRKRPPGSNEFAKVIARIDPESGIRAVVVRKDRRRYVVGAVRAEVTKIRLQVSGEVLRTLVIEGADLAELTTLRKRLGLRDEDNLPVHEALAAELDR